MALRPHVLGRALALLALATLPAAHGGFYRGPGAALAPGGDGGLAATAGGNTPGALAPGQFPTPGQTGLRGSTLDLTQWDLWWRQNQADFLGLKAHVHSTGADSGLEGWFLGDGQRSQRSSLNPTEDQIRGQIVPALLAILARETNNDLLTGALVALAKIGEADPSNGGRADGPDIEAALLRFLSDSSQEVRETAAVALGILASPRTIPHLSHLVWNTKEGQKLVKGSEVDYRTRSFAAYGLGLVGARTASETERQLIVAILRRALEADDTRTNDLEAACLVSLGLVPLATIESANPGASELPPESSRLAQLDYVLGVWRDDEQNFLARAQCPVTLARLLVGLPEPHAASYRGAVARELLEAIERGRERAEVVQSAVLALGQIGTNDGKNSLDLRIRLALSHVSLQVSEPQARAFALMAAAEVGARFGNELTSAGVDDAREFLVEQILNGKNALQPWAGLAGGVLCWQLQRQGAVHPALETLRRVLRSAVEDERSPERVGAYALAAGMAHSLESAPRLMKLLQRELQDDARGQVALGLALLGHGEAIEPLRGIVAGAKYRPELLRQGAMALAILGDKDIAQSLAGMLKEARSLASQAAIASALGFIGDRRSIDPLLALLGDRLVTERARAFAAVALGNVADKEPVPWNAKIGDGLNYRAAPPTLSDPLSGTGILDIY